MHQIVILFITITAVIASNPKQTFCQDDKCLTCIGRYCTTTCEGTNCKNCPLGDCCDGSNCNICRGEKCCATTNCNSCITNCLKICQGVATCHYDCFQQCLPNNNQTSNNNYGSKLISNKNYLPVNVTTIINITNTIHNENFLRNPILINTTNINNYSNHQNYHRKNILISNQNLQRPSLIPKPNLPKQNCCEVVHPEKCQKIQKDEESVCYIKKHNECSSLCIGKHVHIVEDLTQEHQCITIAIKPYWYCGNYALLDCDQCYECEDLDCSQNSDCSPKCRASIIAGDFYNKLYRKS